MTEAINDSVRSSRNGAMPGEVRARANDVLEDFNALSKDVSKLATAASRAARAQVASAGEQVRTASQSLSERARNGASMVSERVREHPGAALGLTLGAGVLLGMFLSRR
jgi:ElaB/YqjD/DUF883 family membrane-anchored ribosome-binding protein